MYKKFIPTQRARGVKADLKRIPPQILIDGRPIQRREELLTTVIWDAKLKKQVKTVQLLFNVRVGFYDVNTKEKRSLAGSFEINTKIKE